MVYAWFTQVYAGYAQGNLLMKVILIHMFLAGNSIPTIPHLYSKLRDSGFLVSCADSAVMDGRCCSNVY